MVVAGKGTRRLGANFWVGSSKPALVRRRSAKVDEMRGGTRHRELKIGGGGKNNKNWGGLVGVIGQNNETDACS